MLVSIKAGSHIFRAYRSNIIYVIFHAQKSTHKVLLTGLIVEGGRRNALSHQIQTAQHSKNCYLIFIYRCHTL